MLEHGGCDRLPFKLFLTLFWLWFGVLSLASGIEADLEARCFVWVNCSFSLGVNAAPIYIRSFDPPENCAPPRPVVDFS